MEKYNFKSIEPKWQGIWEKEKSHKTDLSITDNKFYCLTMFSYPSGDKLHIGHWYNYGPVDTYARFMKMKGNNVFQPQGFDAFGLPAENYAIKHGIHPAESTKNNISIMRSQLKRIGAMFDWDHEVVTCEPDYYKWTQWLFLKLYKMGLAYQKTAPVNWCPDCATVLANEQVKEGYCDRCSTEVTKRNLKQWFFKITDYAEKLLKNLDDLDWPEKTKHMQRNWIGRSDGAKIEFKISNSDDFLEVFTTRPDTIFGATYMVIAPEHPLSSSLIKSENSKAALTYIQEAKSKTEIERLSLDRTKTGVFTGSYAVNPFTKTEIPIWIADYVIISYGTGAIMAVPSGDERDFEFAKKYDLPIIEVISPDGKLHGNDICYSDFGILVNSNEYNGLTSREAISKINSHLKEFGWGGGHTQYRLHDWLISRQRYWGAPIPVIHCEKCGIVPVPEKDLPVNLPENVEFSESYGEDISPLSAIPEYIQAECPDCGDIGRRDADTMDTFVCSSWYFLRYVDANNHKNSFSEKRLNWLPVDLYVGGAEHATMHLLYARFVTMALKDAGILHFEEPFSKLYHQGTITKDGTKMSKSKGNTVSPDEFIEKYGSDIFRAYLMFMGPFDEGGDWSDKGITGIDRFINKVWRISRLQETDETVNKDIQLLHSTIKYVTDDLSQMKFNTAISRLMEFVNGYSTRKTIMQKSKETLIKLIAPITPHLAEEIWRTTLGKNDSVFKENWPKFDPELAEKNTVTIAIQINGKLRDEIEVEKSIEKDDLLSKVKLREKIKVRLDGMAIIREIVVPNRLVNLVVK